MIAEVQCAHIAPGASMRGLIALAALLLTLSAPAVASDYLYVWAMETRDVSKGMPPAAAMGRDFLAVFDVRPSSRKFGALVAMLPVGTKGQMAHHTDYDMGADGRLFANDYMAGQSYIFDLKIPTHPKLVATFSNAGAYTHAHSFYRLADGTTLATYQFKGEPDVAAGALVKLDRNGRMVTASDASDAAADPFIRPYSLAVVPKLDRVVTTSASMLPSKESSHVVQIWRLSDLKLLKTVVLPRPAHFADAIANDAYEPRLLADGKTVLVLTYGCGLYRITDLAGDRPGAEFVYDFGYRACGVPAVVGRYWVQPGLSGHSLVSVDVSDPSHVREVSRVTLPDDALPHWTAKEPGGNRIVITGYGALATKALFARVNPKTGALTLEKREIDFQRKWPDGWNGPAMPHGSVFSR